MWERFCYGLTEGYLPIASLCKPKKQNDQHPIVKAGRQVMEKWEQFYHSLTENPFPKTMQNVLKRRNDKHLIVETDQQTKVEKRLWSIEYTHSIQLGDLYKTAEQIVQMRSVWQRMLTGLSLDKQANLIQQVLRAVAQSLPDNPELDSFQNEPLDDHYLFFGLPLCGLISCLLDQERPSGTAEMYWEGWHQCVSRVYLISATHLGELGNNKETEKYRFLVKLMFVLMAATLMAECATLDDSELKLGNELWLQVNSLSQMLNVNLFRTAFYFPWGRCITLSSTDDWFGAPQGLDVQQTYDLLCMILNKSEDL